MNESTKDPLSTERPITDLLFGLSELLDDEGRPLGERRASSGAKAGVELVLRACPYHDSRRDRPMNVSALAQVSRHSSAVLSELVALRRSQEPELAASWEGMMQVVVDLLFAPGRYWIEQRRAGAPQAPLRGVDAVAHKLAAGYFGVVHGILRDTRRGITHPFTMDHFMSHVDGTRALHGASEVCGGPPTMLDRFTTAFFQPTPLLPANVMDGRRVVARHLTNQLICGLQYQVLDEALECDLFETLGDEPHARNPFIREQYRARRAELDSNPASSFALNRCAATPRAAELDALQAVDALLRDGDAAILAPERHVPRLLEIAATLIQCHRDTAVRQAHLERELRAALSLPPLPLGTRNSLILPQSRTARWLEALTGASLRSDAGLNLKLHRMRKAVINLTPTLEDEAA